jgi:hypothetical protein
MSKQSLFAVSSVWDFHGKLDLKSVIMLLMKQEKN